MASKYRDLMPDEIEALKVFAAEYGKKWKEKLAFDYWMKARVYKSNGVEYPVLHALRNSLGPKWLAKFKLEGAK